MRARARSLSPALALVLAVLGAPPAAATMYRNLSLDELVDHAELVFVGTVRSTTARWYPDKTGVYTFVRFEDLRILKGSLAEGATAFTLRHYGGVVPDRFKAQLAGMPEFRPGDRALMFVEGNGRLDAPIVGLWQGTFRIVRDPASGEERILTERGRSEVLGFGESRLRLRPSAPAGPPAGASPGEEDDPKAKAARLRLEAARRAESEAFRSAPSRPTRDLIEELTARIDARRREGRFRDPRPTRSADPDRDLYPSPREHGH